MFASLFCKATNVADKATEVLTEAADKASTAAKQAQAAAKAKANELTLIKLKKSLEGHVNQMWEAPDVFVTLSDVELQDGVGAVDALNFTIKGLTCNAKVDIIGTAGQLAGMTAAMGTGKVADKVSAGESALSDKLGLPNLGLGAIVAAGADKARQNLASAASSGTKETKSSTFKVTVDLVKTLGVEDVKATVKFVETTNPLAKFMSNGTIQKYIEEAISREVTKQCTLWQNEHVTLDRTKQVVAGKAQEVAKGAKDITELTAKKAQELAASAAKK